LTNHNRASQLTNQSRLGSGFRQSVKIGSMRKIKSFLNIKACKDVTVEAQNTIKNLKNEFYRVPFSRTLVIVFLDFSLKIWLNVTFYWNKAMVNM